MSEWIKWTGGKCPVQEGSSVEIKYRNGFAGIVRAWDWLFENNPKMPELDVVAYRRVDIVECSVEDGKPVTSSDGVCQEADGCPTEGAVLKREWRRLTADLAAARAENKQLMDMPLFREYQHALHRAATAEAALAEHDASYVCKCGKAIVSEWTKKLVAKRDAAEAELALLKTAIEPFKYAAGEIAKALEKDTQSPDAATEIRAEVTDKTDVAIRTAAGLHPRSPMMARIETNFSLDSLELRHWAALHHATKEVKS